MRGTVIKPGSKSQVFRAIAHEASHAEDRGLVAKYGPFVKDADGADRQIHGQKVVRQEVVDDWVTENEDSVGEMVADAIGKGLAKEALRCDCKKKGK